MRIRTTLTTTALVVALAAITQAAITTTPTLTKDSGQQFNCRVLNFNKAKTLDPPPVVTIRSGIGGGVLQTSTFGPVGPGSSGAVTYSGADTVGYCVAEGKFSKKKLLVTLCIQEAVTTECLETVTAP